MPDPISLPPEALAGILRELEQRADDCDTLAARIENSEGLGTGNRRVAGDASAWRAQATKVRAWAALLAAAPAPGPQPSARDRADLADELQLAAEHYESYVSFSASKGRDPAYAAPERERAERVRQLITVFCGEG